MKWYNFFLIIATSSAVLYFLLPIGVRESSKHFSLMLSFITCFVSFILVLKSLSQSKILSDSNIVSFFFFSQTDETCGSHGQEFGVCMVGFHALPLSTSFLCTFSFGVSLETGEKRGEKCFDCLCLSPWLVINNSFGCLCVWHKQVVVTTG